VQLAIHQNVAKMRGGKKLSVAGDKLDRWQEMRLKTDREPRTQRAEGIIVRWSHSVLKIKGNQ
jgi:hypothetical protein